MSVLPSLLVGGFALGYFPAMVIWLTLSTCAAGVAIFAFTADVGDTFSFMKGYFYLGFLLPLIGVLAAVLLGKLFGGAGAK